MPFVAYARFAAAHRRLVAFGFLAAFTSSFGQTYYIGIFGPAIQSEFGLSHSAWGTIYMLGTLASAALLPWTGKQIDRLDLRLYTGLVGLAGMVACAATALAVNPAMLVVAIFLLRQSGQGLMSHVSITSMARYFDAGRGRAIAIATVGFAAGEAFLPFVAVLMIAAVGWRWSYAATALALAFVLVPIALWLLRGHVDTHHPWIAWPYLFLIGVSTGVSHTAGSAMWPRSTASPISAPSRVLPPPSVFSPRPSAPCLLAA